MYFIRESQTVSDSLGERVAEGGFLVIHTVRRDSEAEKIGAGDLGLAPARVGCRPTTCICI